MILLYAGNNIFDRRIPVIFQILFRFLKFPIYISKKQISFVCFNAHDNHISISVLCYENRLPCLMTQSRNRRCIF